MTDQLQSRISQINREMSAHKSQINNSQNYLKMILSKQNSMMNTPSSVNNRQASPENKKQQNYGEQSKIINSNAEQKKQEYSEKIGQYFNHLTTFKQNLQEKCKVLQQKHAKQASLMQEQKNILLKKVSQYENETKTLKKQINSLHEQKQSLNKKAASTEIQMKKLKKGVYLLQSNLQQSLNQKEKLKRQNEGLLQQIQNLKSDNKIILVHIDRLKRQQSARIDGSMQAQRQIRVMRSLYQQVPHDYQQKKIDWGREYRDDPEKKYISVVEENQQLRKIVTKLNQQMEILKRQNKVLTQQNNNNSQLLRNQKQIAQMRQQEINKHKPLIDKMVAKIQSLELINQTLRKQLNSQQDSELDYSNYYKQTRTKAGHFYYKQ